MAVNNPSISGHIVPPDVAMAIPSDATTVRTDRPAVAQMPMGDSAPELGNIMAANIRMAAADRHDQRLT